MMFKILAVVSLLSIMGSGYAGYTAGGNYVRAQMTELYEAQRTVQSNRIEELIALNQVKKVIYRDKIKVIRKSSNTDKCAKTVAPPAILDSLR